MIVLVGLIYMDNFSSNIYLEAYDFSYPLRDQCEQIMGRIRILMNSCLALLKALRIFPLFIFPSQSFSIWTKSFVKKLPSMLHTSCLIV